MLVGSSPVDKLPNEILIYIFAQQNEQFLVDTIARVCKRWNQIINLDVFWSEAFQSKWGSLPITPCLFKSAKDSADRKVVFWRQEYLLRQKLECVWQYGALQAVSFDAIVGSLIDNLQFSACGNGLLDNVPKSRNLSWNGALKSNPKLIASSTESGIVVNCNPRTGNIERAVLRICKDEDEEMNISDTVACISPASVGMNMSWVLGSKLDGSIMACFQTFGGEQGLVNSSKIWFPRVHSERVHVLLPLSPFPFLDEVAEKLFHHVDSMAERQGPLHSIFRSNHLFFLSAGTDGRVAMYSTLYPSRVLVTFEGMEEPISSIAIIDDGLVAGTCSGNLFFWKLPIRPLLQAFQNPVLQTLQVQVSKTMTFPTTKSAAPSPIVKIYHDFLTKILLVQQKNGAIYSCLSTPEGLGKFFPLDNSEHKPKDLTTLAFQASSKSSSTALLVTGYSSGLVLIWKARPNHPFELVSTLKDQRNAISCIHLSPFLMATGSDDGSVYLYDTVAFKMFRGLNNKHRNQTVLQDRFRVNQIVNYGFMLCICQSQGITSWTLRPKQEKTQRKASSVKVPISNSKALQGSSNSHTRQDVQYDIEQTMSQLEKRRMSLMREKELVNSANGNVKTHEMSEQELLEYAKVLSSGGSTTTPDFGGNLSEAEALELALVLSLSEASSSK